MPRGSLEFYSNEMENREVAEALYFALMLRVDASSWHIALEQRNDVDYNDKYWEKIQTSYPTEN